nr:LOW QUALITY PROTEIN: uncharacterized protein ARIH2OS [Microcebus murinus]
MFGAGRVRAAGSARPRRRREGGAPARPGKRAGRPPHWPARVNKAATRATHLPGVAAQRPLSPGGPETIISQFRSGLRGAGAEISAYAPRRSLGAPGAATIPGFRFLLLPLSLTAQFSSLHSRSHRSRLGAVAHACNPSTLGRPQQCQACILTFLLQFLFYNIRIVIMTSSYLLGPIVKYCE